MLIFQGDPWVRARDARETDLMLAVEGSVRGVFPRVSLPSRAIYKPVLCSAFCYAELVGL